MGKAPKCRIHSLHYSLEAHLMTLQTLFEVASQLALSRPENDSVEERLKMPQSPSTSNDKAQDH
jgi:hypothetical protein